MVLLKTLFHSIQFKLFFLILYPSILKRYIKVSPFSGRLRERGREGADKGVTGGGQVVLYFSGRGEIMKLRILKQWKNFVTLK